MMASSFPFPVFATPVDMMAYLDYITNTSAHTEAHTHSEPDASTSATAASTPDAKPATAPRHPGACYVGKDGQLVVHNVAGVIRRMTRDVLVCESALFPAHALEFYTAHNLDSLRPDDNHEHAALYATYYNAARGGGQGDYRSGIQTKIDNVVDALTRFPASKRAVLTIPDRSVDHRVDEDAKCLREVHFYVDGPPEDPESPLSATGFMRAQAASIFPKNIHFIGTLMNIVAERLARPVGSYTHFVTTMTSGR